VSIRLLAPLILAPLVACAPPPPPPKPPPPPPVVPVTPPTPAALPEVAWAFQIADEDSVSVGGELAAGADKVEAAVVSVTCSPAKIGFPTVLGEHLSLRLEAADIAAAIQCRGLKITTTRGKQATTTELAFDLTIALAPDNAGTVGLQRTTKSPDVVLTVSGTAAASQISIGRDAYPARGVKEDGVEFALPILSLVRAALHHEHAIAKTGGRKPIECIPGLSVGGQPVP
jgi:hypothetical protein